MFKITEKNGNYLLLNKRKVYIQNFFREKLRLLIDIPKSGLGTNNDSNTARLFFKYTSISAKMMGINEELIKRFSIILQTLSCGYYLNFEKFGSYCFETVQMYI